MSAGECAYMCMWRLGVSLGCCSSSVIHVVFETRSLYCPRASWRGWAGWSASPMGPPTLRFQACAQPFYVVLRTKLRSLWLCYKLSLSSLHPLVYIDKILGHLVHEMKRTSPLYTENTALKQNLCGMLGCMAHPCISQPFCPRLLEVRALQSSATRRFYPGLCFLESNRLWLCKCSILILEIRDTKSRYKVGLHLPYEQSYLITADK